MRRKILAPLLLILVLAGGGLAATLVAGNSPELGLDLQGGVSVVLAPTGEASGEALDQSVSIIRERVDGLGVAEPDITRQGDAIVVQLPGVENRERVLELVGQTAELRFRPVLGAPGSEAPAAGTPAPGDPAAADEGAGTGDGATDGSGDTGEPGEGGATGGDGDGADGGGDAAGAEGDAGADEGAAATGGTGTSEGALGARAARPAVGVPLGESAAVVQEAPEGQEPGEPTTTTAPEEGEPAGEGGAGEPAPEAQEPAGLELTPREEDEADATVVLADENGIPYRLGPTLATGRVVESAQATIPQGQWLVELTMRSGEDGIELFNQAAAECYTRSPTCPTGALAIVLDSVVQSAPNINAPTYDRDEIVITGQFGEDEAKDLALVLRYGSLPVELERQSVQTVSATLGDDSLRAGIIAGTIGLVLVALYMVLYYRALGVVVIGGFAVWAALMYTVVSWLGRTQGLALTLAGVTGMIMSIGVTVDSYVVFFERLKEEIRAGRTLRSSIERAFKRAFRTIVAGNMSAFIGAGVLWWLTVGSVRGFALFLGLSTALGVVVTWFYTRPVVTLLARNRVFTEMPFLGVARGAAVPGRRRDAAGAAGVGR
ncbi:MAG TPA: protein translocase subunit SecD [Acidimicrobiales bacterium]